MLIFVHIPKTAGTAITTELQKKYGVEHIYTYRPLGISPYVSDVHSGRWNSNKEILSFENEPFFIEELIENQEKIKCVVGHIPYGVHRYLSKKCKYFTIIRDPVERIWSLYNSCVNAGKDEYFGKIIRKFDYNLISVMESQLVEFCNDQVRMISGSSKLELDITDFNNCIALIKRDYFCIPFNNLNRLYNLIGIDIIYKSSKASYTKITATPPQGIKKIIEKNNMWDIKLYDWCNSQ